MMVVFLGFGRLDILRPKLFFGLVFTPRFREPKGVDLSLDFLGPGIMAQEVEALVPLKPMDQFSMTRSPEEGGTRYGGFG